MFPSCDFVLCSKFLYFKWGGGSISVLEHCVNMKFRIQLLLTLIYTKFKYCHVSVNLDNVNVLYLENGNVDTPVLNIKAQLWFFLKKLVMNMKS